MPWIRPLVPLLFLALGCASAGRLHEAQWLRVQSANFELWSLLDESESRELVTDLELFRAIVDRTVGGTRVEPRIPTRIFAFDTARNWRPFSPGRRTAGYFAADMRGNHLCLLADRRWSTEELMRHEYAHYLLHNGSAAYPAWYNEGFAMFLSTVRVEDDYVEVGHPPTWIRMRWYRGRWLDVRELINPSQAEWWPDARSVMFYTQAWALVHYLHFGREDDPALSAELAQYLQDTASGIPPNDAFERAFGMSLGEVNLALAGYVRRGKLGGVRVGLGEFPFQDQVRVTPANPSEVAYQLGRLLLILEQPEAARGYFGSALALDPADARAEAGVGAAFGAEQRWPEGEAAFEQAIAMGPEQAEVFLDFGRFLQARAEAAIDAGEADRARALVEQARSQYVRSWKLDDQVPETYAMYGETFTFDGEDPARGLEGLEHAERLLPSSLEIKLMLARLYLRLGRTQQARERALTAFGWSHDAEQRQEARELIEEIDATPSPSGSATDPCAERSLC